MKNPTISDIKLALLPAMLGNIDVALRALSVTIDCQREEIVLHALYQCSPDEDQRDLIDCIASELDAYLGSFNVVTQFEAGALNARPRLPGLLVYRRHEKSR